MSDFDLWFQRLYWLSQIALPIIAVVTGWIVWTQHRTSKVFALIRYLEDPRVRSARRLLYKNLIAKSPPEKWWVRDDDLEDAAATVCVRYSIVGVMTKNDKWVREFIAREWANNIRRTYEALTGYLEYRRDSDGTDAYSGYQELYDATKPQKRSV